MIFVMISTKNSVCYTDLALTSFLRNTHFDSGDKFLLVANEPGSIPNGDKFDFNRNFVIVKNETPKGFAENINIGLDLALRSNCGVICLNNDIVFTPSWIDFVQDSEEAIVLPFCNQQNSYSHDGLELKYLMSIDDFNDRFAQLEWIAERHVAAHINDPPRRDVLMPFYCFYIPQRIISEVGKFDETFGTGGAEDVDYRFRALLAGFDVRYSARSYVLHFMGQSTWRSGEAPGVTAKRYSRYHTRFEEKWGGPLASIFTVGGDLETVSRNLGVERFLEQGDFRKVIEIGLRARAIKRSEGANVKGIKDLSNNPHTGLNYLELMKLLGQELKPRSYLEIGTQRGFSLRQFECDSLCIDPEFKVSQEVLVGKRRAFFFQMTSDEFFREYDLKTFFPKGVDIAFLDGLHYFEALLRDFISVERYSHPRSVILLHDCLPTNLEMTVRAFNGGDWTGDVWRLLPIFKKYRPDLRIRLLDCPPTGLVACTNLDCQSRTLEDKYYDIIDEFVKQELNEASLRDLRELFPFLSTADMRSSPEYLPAIFG